MKKMIQLATIALLALQSNAVFASITDVDPQDKSVEYLRLIFGSVVDIITGGTGPASPDSIIGALSEILNAGMLIFTGLIVGYTFITGVLNSAHEGNPLGKMYSTNVGTVKNGYCPGFGAAVFGGILDHANRRFMGSRTWHWLGKFGVE